MIYSEDRSLFRKLTNPNCIRWILQPSRFSNRFEIVKRPTVRSPKIFVRGDARNLHNYCSGQCTLVGYSYIADITRPRTRVGRRPRTEDLVFVNVGESYIELNRWDLKIDNVSSVPALVTDVRRRSPDEDGGSDDRQRIHTSRTDIPKWKT